MPFLKDDMELLDLFEEAEMDTAEVLTLDDEGATEAVSVIVDGALSTSLVAPLSFSSGSAFLSRSSSWVNS